MSYSRTCITVISEALYALGARETKKNGTTLFGMYRGMNIVLHNIIKMFGGLNENNISRTEIKLSFLLRKYPTQRFNFLFKFSVYILDLPPILVKMFL